MRNFLRDRAAHRTMLIAISVGTVILTVVSLTFGIYEVFPYLYILPLMLISYLYPQRGMIAALLLGGVYVGMIYAFGIFDLTRITVSSAWFYVIISVGVVVSSLSEGLRREERRYHGIFENTQSGLLTVDPDTLQIVETNQECARMLGSRVVDLVGLHLATIWPDERERKYIFSRLRERFPPGDMEVQLLNRQGQARWALIAAALTPEGLVILSTVDITQRKQIENSLMDSEIKFRTIVQKSLAGVFVIQGEKFRYVNPRYAEIHEYRPDELIDQLGPRNLVFPEDWESVRDFLEDTTPPKSRFIQYHCRERTKSGGTIFVEVLGSRTVYRGKPAIMGTLLDVTDQRKADNALRQANNKLNLLSSITRHDILNHLTAIQGYMGLALDSNQNDEIDTFLRNATKVTEKAQNLLQFTRDYQNMGLQDPEWQTLSDVIVRSLPVITSPQIAVRSQVDGLDIYADKLLEKVFYNLIDNTLRHGNHATEIHISYHEEEKGLILVYEDNGQGIPDSEKTLIFNRGYGKNTGFGLFLIREILSITNMTIMETGMEGEGARFEIAVPKGNYRLHTPPPIPLAERSRA
jgi:PAS domain S-box-containing protein